MRVEVQRDAVRGRFCVKFVVNVAVLIKVLFYVKYW